MESSILDLLRALLRANDDMAEDGRACWCTSKSAPCEACAARDAIARITRQRAAEALG